MEHPVLERIGPYRLTKHLGASDTMQVYLAREDGGPSRDVVLKIVQNLTADDARLVEQLRREAPARRRLNHPSIVRTYRVFDHESSLVYAVENVQGASLAELMRSGAPQSHRSLSDAAAFYIATSVLNALAHAHGASSPSGARAPVIHKAVNPSNIRIARDGAVKLGGFGFVNTFGLRADRTGKLEWESAYMAPEQITGQALTPKVDVYAVGLILWELLTGRRARIPPTDPLDTSALRATIERAPESIMSLRPDLPKDVIAVVNAALEPSPEKRNISCAEMARRIRRVAQDQCGRLELRERARATMPTATSEGRMLGPPEHTAPGPKAGASARSKEGAVFEGTLLGLGTPNLPSGGAKSGSLSSARAQRKVAATPVVDIYASTEPMSEPSRSTSSRAPVVLDNAPIGDEPTIEWAEEEEELPFLLEQEITSTGAPDSTDSRISRSASAWPTIVHGLRTPTRWSRGIWLATWVALSLPLGALVFKLSTERMHDPSKDSHRAATGAALVPAQTQSTVASNVQTNSQPVPSPIPQPSATAPPTPSSEEPADALPGPGFGYLTVHSASSSALVYIGSKKCGAAEEKLVVPCGQQFVTIGAAVQDRKEPVWLASTRTVQVPCGESIEVTINGRVPK